MVLLRLGEVGDQETQILSKNRQQYIFSTKQKRILDCAYAEQLDAKKDFAQVHTTFEKFLVALSADLDEPDKQIQSANLSSQAMPSAPRTRLQIHL
jgi:hypothetical protein